MLGQAKVKKGDLIDKTFFIFQNTSLLNFFYSPLLG